MKKLTKKALEARLQDIANEPTPADLERFEAMKERVHAEYLRREASEKAAHSQHNAPKRNYRHYVMAAFIMAIAFLVIPVVYTALFPVTVSSANNLMRRAGIWINNTLRLGIEFPEPVIDERYSESPANCGSYSFQTENELSAYLGKSSFALDTNYSGLTLISINVNIFENDLTRISFEYTYNGNHILLTCESIKTDTAINLHTNATELSTPAGTLFYWSTSTAHRATGIFSTWNIQLKADAALPNAKDIFSTLHMIN